MILQVFQGVTLLLQLVGLGVDEAHKLKALLERSPDVQVSISDAQGQAIAADEETIARVAEWKARHGLS
jgi:hypothetical protein